MNQDNWKAWIRQTYQWILEAGLTVKQLHGPLNLYIPDDFHFEPPAAAVYRCLEACRMMECERIVFHPVFYLHRVQDAQTRKKVLNYNIRWFGMLLDTAREWNVKIQLENTFDFKKLQQHGDQPWPFTTADDLLTVLESLGPQAEACLDTGHANISSQNCGDFARRLGTRLQTLHLNDNVGAFSGAAYEDLHLFPGNGNIDWNGFFDALREIAFDGVFNLEPVGSLRTSTPKLCRAQIKGGIELLRAMLEQAGWNEKSFEKGKGGSCYETK